MKIYFYSLSILLTILLFVPLGIRAQKKTGDSYTQQVQVLVKNKQVNEAFAIIDNLEPITRKEHIELNEVPAPPFKESVRAQYYKKMLEAAGPDKVWIDSMGNVLALRKGKKGGRTVEKANIETHDDVLFVATVGEEGLGDLQGVKFIIEKSKLKIDSWIAIDGTEINSVVNGALGSVRYKALINGPGGHSWGAFGLGNPHHAMAKAMNYFADEAARFTSTGIKTSFNVGRTGGGTSVNSIPFESWAEVDMRSESPSQLKKIDSIFKSAMKRGVDDYNSGIKKGPALTLHLERIGYRPSGTTSEKEPLVQRAMAAAKQFTTNPQLTIVSTNANIPIAHGIPAITVGAGGKSNHEHSLDEWWLNDKGADGIKFVLLTLLMEAGLEKK